MIGAFEGSYPARVSMTGIHSTLQVVPFAVVIAACLGGAVVGARAAADAGDAFEVRIPPDGSDGCPGVVRVSSDRSSRDLKGWRSLYPGLAAAPRTQTRNRLVQRLEPERGTGTTRYYVMRSEASDEGADGEIIVPVVAGTAMLRYSVSPTMRVIYNLPEACFLDREPEIAKRITGRPDPRPMQ